MMRLLRTSCATLLWLGCSVVISGEALKPPSPPAPSPQQRLLDQLAELVGREPRHVGALYTAARVAAGIGDHDAALRWLDRLAAVGLGDELDPDDFGALAATPPYRERAARFAQAAPPVGTASLWAETACADLLPEGTAWDARRGVLLVSSGRQRAVFAIERGGGCRRLTPPGERRLLAVLGMTVDASTDSLWVATAAAPFMFDADAADAGVSVLARIDLASGRVLASYRVDGGAMLNDLARAADGTLYVTESRGGRIYRLTPGAQALEPLTTDRPLEGPNGIVALDSGALLIADFHGLSRAVPGPGDRLAITRLATPDHIYLGGIDGLTRHGRWIVGIQNLVGRTRVWSLALDDTAPRVAQARLLLRGHPDFLNPTTGAVANHQFLFVADTKLQSALPGGGLSVLAPGRRGHRVLSLALPGDEQAGAAGHPASR